MNTNRKHTLLAIAGLALGLSLSACAVLETAAEHDVGVRIATAEFIGGDADTAAGVVDFAEDAQERLDGDPEVELEQLKAAADEMIPWGDLSAGQRILAEELLRAVERRLREEIDEGLISADAVASLRSLLQTIERAAARELRLAG